MVSIINNFTIINDQNSFIESNFKHAIFSRYNSRRTKLSDFLAFLLSKKVDQTNNIFFDEHNIDEKSMEEAYKYFTDADSLELKTPEIVKNPENAIEDSMNIDLNE